MILEAWISIGVCMIALVMTISLVRRSGDTLALPLAYMINLLLIHVPGAYAFALSGGEYSGLVRHGTSIADGITLTAIGSVCFVAGLALVNGRPDYASGHAGSALARLNPAFVIYCMASGWILAFGVGALRSIPTIGAAIYFGSAIWMLVAMVGLSSAVFTGSLYRFLTWLGVLLAYPFIVLAFSGFLSYGATAVIIVGSLAVIQGRSTLKSVLVILALSFLGISVFVNYFSSRVELRSTLWSASSIEQRIGAIGNAFANLEVFSPSNPNHLRALTLRLNQNEFVGIAVNRLKNGQSDYLMGRSYLDALASPIPRVIWKNKPLEGGSGRLVKDMTGLRLASNTSWGVGNVMEFYINFGLWSLIPSFVVLGMLIGWLDRQAARYLSSYDPARSLIYFLPCVAVIQPNGSLVEIVGGAFAAILAAVGLRFGWNLFAALTDKHGDLASTNSRYGAR